MSLRFRAAIFVVWAIFVVAPAAAQTNDYGVRDPSVGTIPGLDAFTPAFNCPGKHLSKVVFTSFSLNDNFVQIPWITVPKVVEYGAGESMPSVDVDLNVGQLGPGKHQGVVSLQCVACDQGACAGQTVSTLVSVEIPHPNVFGSSPADAQFGGLVNGQPVTANELLPNVLGDIKKSGFANLPGATAIFTTLDNNYLDVDVLGPELSDVSFVRTTDDNNATTGRFGTQVVEVDGNDPGPGEGAYTVNYVGGEELYIGVDMSSKGILEARQSPADYYVFTLGGQMGVIEKADLVHNLIHEGLHATVAGKYNVARPRGTSSGAPLEEEQEGFRVGNAAAAALGLPPESTVPQAGGYNAGSNTAYPPLFPTLVPGAAGGTGPAAPPAAGTTPAPAGSASPASGGDKSSSSLLPSYNSNPDSGFCVRDGNGLSCDGAPNFALACNESAMGGAGCTLEGTGLAEPCSFAGGKWMCNELPPAVVQCSATECMYASEFVADVCHDEGDQFACVSVPAFGLSCESAGNCRLAFVPTQENVDCPAGECENALAGVAGPSLSGATQNIDCSKAGTGESMPLRSIAGNFVDSEIFFSRSPASPDDAGAETLMDVLKRLGSSTDWFAGADSGFYSESFDRSVILDYEYTDREMDFARASDTRAPATRPANERPQALMDPYEFMFTPTGFEFGYSSWPGAGSRYVDVGADQSPFKGVIRAPGNATGIFNLGDFNFQLQGRSYGSINFETPPTALGPGIEPFVNQQMMIGATSYTSLVFEEHNRRMVINVLVSIGIADFEGNPCRVVLLPTDPNYLRTGRHGGNSWGAREDDQWAIKRVGFTDDEESAWNLLPELAQPVVVAVIDTGLDWHHLDINAKNVWRNSAERPGNGIDDDENGYVDDIIGWDFLENNNRPWDFDGHGTVVAGIIAAAHNDVGIAGINPNARIMVLKAVNNFGTTRASFLAEAIVYAVDNGAQVINISIGGTQTSRMETAAIDYARERGVLVVAASGNDGVELDDFGPGGNDKVLTVGATHIDDRAAEFSNFGDKIDLVAPGVDVLSLRARFTDANFRPGTSGNEEYALGDNYVGDDKRYVRVSGTSFSTPIVTGIASLLLSKNPELTAADVERILTQTATDVDFAGNDKYTGHGMVNAQAALSVDPDFSITAEITALEPMPADAPSLIRVVGTVDASSFKRAWTQIGPGENPSGWRYVGQKRKYPITDGTLGMIPINEFRGSEVWQVVINVEHQNGVIKRATYPIKIR